MTNKEQIIAKALEFLKDAPQGIRYSELVARISDALPQIPKNSIHGTIWNLEVQLPAQVVKPARGLYVGTQCRQQAVVEPDAVPVSPAEKIKEERFYEPFADWQSLGNRFPEPRAQVRFLPGHVSTQLETARVRSGGIRASIPFATMRAFGACE